jgi:CubicO group peptidase (beta-lactamase class C family)
MKPRFVPLILAALPALIAPLPLYAESYQSPTPAVFAPRLQHFVDDNIMAGAVLLFAGKDRIQDLEAVGYSDLGTKKPMQTDSLFWIASMSKTFTAAAFMMLVDEGRVSIDDPVQKYIPEFKDVRVTGTDGSLIPPGHPLLIREILSHTSGLGFLNRKDKQKIDSVPLETSIKDDLLEPLHYQPGTKYSYSNEGIDTAGRIIEIVSGMSYEKFLQDRIFTPLGLTDTTFHPSAQQLQRLARSYKTKADKTGLEEVPIHYLTYPLDGPARYPAPGGGLFSTARDVCRFCQMLANGGTFEGKTYLSKEAVHEMTIKETGPLVADKYGFGVSGSGDGRSFGHGGAYQTDMNVSDGWITVFLVQQAGPWLKGNPGSEFQQLSASMRPANSATAASPPPARSAVVGTQVPPP